MIDAFVEVARDVETEGQRREKDLVAGLKNLLMKALRAHNCRMPEHQISELLALDLELNAQGLSIWLDKN